MKRNMDLIRSILLELEDKANGYDYVSVEVPGYTNDEITYHKQLLLEAGLVKGFCTEADKEKRRGLPQDRSITHSVSTWIRATQVRGLTWAGHDFLDAAREDTRWDQAKKIFQRLGGVTLEIAMDILKRLMTQQVDVLMR